MRIRLALPTNHLHQVLLVSSVLIIIILVYIIQVHKTAIYAAQHPKPVWAHEVRGGVYGVCISSDGKVIVSSSGRDPIDRTSLDKGEIKIWDMKTGILIQTVYEDNDPAWAVAVSKDGSSLACSIGKRVEIWRLKQGIFKRSILIPTSVSALEFSPDSRFLAGKERNSIFVWNAKSGRVIWQKVEDATYVPENPKARDDWSTRQRNTDMQRWLHFSPDGKHLAVPVLHWQNGSDLLSKVELLNSLSGKSIFSSKHDKVLQAGSFSNDGEMIALGGISDIIVLKADDLSDAKSIHWVLPPLSVRMKKLIDGGRLPERLTRSIAFTKHDDKIVIVPYEGDPHIQIVSVLTGTGINILMKTHKTGHDCFPAMAFSLSGNELAVASWGMISLYRVDDYVKKETR